MKQYTLKIYPEGQARKAYRIIEISGNDTLDRLCEVTQTSHINFSYAP